MSFENENCYPIAMYLKVFDKKPYCRDDYGMMQLLTMVNEPLDTEKNYTPLFVIGEVGVKDGKRTVYSRSALILDADHPKDGFLNRVRNVICNGDYATDVSWGYYTSASATAAQPRYRVIVLLDSEITNAEIYRKICSALMADIAPDDVTAAPEEREFDWSSCEFGRLMYMPTKPVGSEFFESALYDGQPLNVDEVTGWILHFDYSTAFAVHGNKSGYKADSEGKKTASCCCSGGSFSAPSGAQDPREKDSIIGSFCKVFDVESAIEAFDLPYSRAGDRWIYDGSSSGMPGVSISDCGNFLLSNHESDPASRRLLSNHESDPAGGRLQNAYDLVRIHKQLDNKAMYKLAMRDEQVKAIETERAAAYKAKMA